jgi:hypothetical protein
VRIQASPGESGAARRLPANPAPRRCRPPRRRPDARGPGPRLPALARRDPAALPALEAVRPLPAGRPAGSVDTARHALWNPQSGRCLDATGPSPANGTRLQIWDRAYTANQQWNLPA